MAQAIREYLTRAGWLGIVLMWFWPLTLAAVSLSVLGYLAYAIWFMWPGVNW